MCDVQCTCIPWYALSRFIHRSQSEKYIWKPWLVYRMVRYGRLGVQTWESPPPFLWQPPPLWRVERGCAENCTVKSVHSQRLEKPPPAFGLEMASSTWPFSAGPFTWIYSTRSWKNHTMYCRSALGCKLGSSDFPRSLCFKWFWVNILRLRLV